MKFDIAFPGGLEVDAHIAGHTIHTDQRLKHGGGDTGPPPFDLFLASIATCMGLYALRFCQQRQIDTQGLHLELETVRNPDSAMIDRICIHLTVPAAFPDKYIRAIERSMDQCTVKKHMMSPPRFETETSYADRSNERAS